MSEPSPAIAPHSETPYPAAAVGWYATVLLAFLYWLSILDRFIISLLVDPIKRDLGLSDFQFGLLHGFAFAITYSLFGLIAGTLADRFSRRWIIFASVSVWSLATTLCGMAQHYWQLMLARVGVGVGEAGLNPCATSMIADLFPRHKLTTAMAVYAIGASVGSGCAYLFGGMIVQAVSEAPTFNLPLVGAVRSWQAVFFIVGVPGLLASLLVFSMPEPKRRGVRQHIHHETFWQNATSGYRGLLKFMSGKKRFFLFHYLGFGFASMSLVGNGAWYPAHMGRNFGWDATQIGLSLGLTLVIAGTIGKIISGICVDAMYKRGYRDAQFRWYAGSLLAAAPCVIIATLSQDPWVFLGGISLFLILLSPLPACAGAALNLVTPNELRGAGIAFFASTSGLIATSLGAILIAGVSDYLLGGNQIGQGIALVAAVCCPLAALFLYLGCKPMREAMAEAEQWEESQA